MTRAATLAGKKIAQLSQVESDLRMLLDNPDDAGLHPGDEIHLHQAIDNITLAMKSLENLANHGEKP